MDNNRYKIIIRNSGKTPAFRVTAWIIATEASGDFASPKKIGVQTDLGAVGPNCARSINGTFEIPWREHRVAIKDGGELRVYIRGVVEYEDAFGSKRWTHFHLDNKFDQVHEFLFTWTFNGAI